MEARGDIVRINPEGESFRILATNGHQGSDLVS